MNNKVFVSCAVTGSGDTAGKHPDLPKTPEQIAKAAIDAAKAGAAIAHIHVREKDGKPSRRLELYKEVVDRVRSSDTDVILNLTTGMGGDLDIGQGDNPLEFGPLTDMANVMERIANAEQFLPEICTLDCGTLNFGDSSVITVNTPNDLRKAAKKLKEIALKDCIVCSTGGGIILDESNHEILKQSFCVYLYASIDSLCQRLEDDDSRPLLSNGNKHEVLQNIFENRQSKYEALSTIKIDTDNSSIEDNCETITKQING